MDTLLYGLQSIPSALEEDGITNTALLWKRNIVEY